MSLTDKGVNDGVVLLASSSVFLMRSSGRIQWVSAPDTKSKQVTALLRLGRPLPCSLESIEKFQHLAADTATRFVLNDEQ